jgi:hypothetical protein
MGCTNLNIDLYEYFSDLQNIICLQLDNHLQSLDFFSDFFDCRQSICDDSGQGQFHSSKIPQNVPECRLLGISFLVTVAIHVLSSKTDKIPVDIKF